METYTIRLPEFEGPFDLLLFFIERDELDIHNIPVAKITGDFLDYLHTLESLNIEVASEFVFVASSLLRIKAKMMLPRFRSGQFDPGDDPRQELIQQLVEYRKYKATLEQFRRREAENMLLVKRGNLSRELEEINRQISGEAALETLTLFKLLHTFERVMERFDKQERILGHAVIKYPYTAEQSKVNLLESLKLSGQLSAEKIFKNCNDRLQAIFTFLALLELIQSGLVHLINGEGVNNFYLSINPSSENNITEISSTPEKGT